EEEALRHGGIEHRTLTGHERRAAPFDYKLAKRTVRLNGATQIALTKLDVMFPRAKGIRALAGLPREARDFISQIENETKTPVILIGTGSTESDVIDLRTRS